MSRQYVDPAYFQWGNAFTGGMQQAQEQGRRDEMMGMERQQQQRIGEMQQFQMQRYQDELARLAQQQQAEQAAIPRRAQILKEILPDEFKDMAAELAPGLNDEDIARLVQEHVKQQNAPAKLMKGADGTMVPEVPGARFYDDPSAAQAAPAGQREYEFFNGLGPEEQARFLEMRRGYAGPEGAAALAAAKAQGSTIGKVQGERDATLEGDLAKIDDEINRTKRLIQEFQAGKYQTGYLAGKLPNVRTAAQDLQREQGKDVIGAISSATFGALSEGEREFLRNLGISENNSEESNINLLTRRQQELEKARDRLKKRPNLAAGPGRSPSGPAGAKRVKVDAEGNVIGD
jgi:hypothetical protein